MSGTGSERASGDDGDTDRDTEAEDGPRWGAFSYPNYRLYWVSMVARVFGLQFRFIGQAWLVFVELDRSPLWLGIVGLASALPTILLSVPAGIIADRFDTRRVLVFSQSLTALLTFGMATLIVTGLVNIWLVIGWAIIVGALAALANPAQAAILPRLIEAGASVAAYDPAAMQLAAPMLPDVEMVGSAYEAIEGASAVVLITEWNEFRALDLRRLKDSMETPVFVDLRNVYPSEDMRQAGFEYSSIGRS